MASLQKEDLQSFDRIDDSKVLVSNEVLLEELIDGFEDKNYDDFAETLRAVNRAYLIKTTDLVDNNNMVGARVTFVDKDGDAHRAIVIEPSVADMSVDEAWDPHRQEMVDPSTYPLGTVQLIYGSDGELGTDDYFFSRTDDLEVATSVIPAREPDSTYCYYVGWDADVDSD